MSIRRTKNKRNKQKTNNDRCKSNYINIKINFNKIPLQRLIKVNSMPYV